MRQQLRTLTLVGGLAVLMWQCPHAAEAAYSGHTVGNLINQLQSDVPKKRLQAAYELGQMGGGAEAAVPALAGALANDRETLVRFQVAQTLGQIGAAARRAVPALAEAMRDKDAFVRFGAAEALGRIGPGARRAVPDLQAALNDKHVSVRAAAAEALKKTER